MKKLLLFTAFFSLTFLHAQVSEIHVDDRTSSVTEFDLNDQNSILEHLAFENIGPTVFSGRVVDIAVHPEDPSIFYVAYASGGLWKTVNNGTTFTPIFDNEQVMTIGAIAVHWTSGIIWVGTGEVNSSRSSYAGVGVYKSHNDGESWDYLGLPESHHIGRILLDPENDQLAVVAVLGHLYTQNSERGVYKTTNGGDTWEQTLAINDKTGVVDLVADTQDKQVIYAAAWERDRKAWNFTEAGPGSGIYKSTNQGESWSLITDGNSGFPQGEGVGRIGLAISGNDSGQKLYALLDNYDRRPDEAEAEDNNLTKEDLRNMSQADFLELDNDRLDEFLRGNRFPRKYSAKSVKKLVEKGDAAPVDLVIFTEDANSLLFDTPVIGAELYVSEDKGASWTKTHDEYLDAVYFSYGYYFGVIAADPNDPDQVYIAGVPILRSGDGGKSFSSINGQNVHVDHHKIWVNPRRKGHLINGNDGGINISYDNGENWIKCNSPSVGQFYYINADNATPYNVYGGTQDNGVWMGQHTYRSGVRWHNTGQYPYRGILGGDGMQVQIDTRDNVTVYTGLQFGNYFRLNTKTNQRKRITPAHDLGERPYRWNWQSPIHVSKHNQDIVYFGANKLFRSMNQGDDFDPISGDLTRGGRKGDVAFGTLSCIHESPMQFGLIYTGSDDGLIHVTRDAGHSWENISDTFDNDLWVARIQASAHVESRVYVCLNGYRNDDFQPYLYVSEDYGKTWNDIGTGRLPDEPINVVKEDPHVGEIIYVGTDRATYVSLDRGQSYTRLKDGLTSAPVHDLVIQAEAKDLLIGTHGRSIYRANVAHLHELVTRQDEELIVFEIPDKRYRPSVGNRPAFYRDVVENDLEIPVYSKEARSVQLSIFTKDDVLVYETEHDLPRGMSKVTYDLSVDGDNMEAYQLSLEDDKKEDFEASDNEMFYLLAGQYKVMIAWGEQQAEGSFKITD